MSRIAPRPTFVALRASKRPPTEQYACTLTCRQCAATTPAQKRCTRTVCIGLPYCWQHARSVLHVRVGETADPQVGRGLFAYDRTMRGPVFRKGDLIVSYEPAEILNQEQVDERYDYERYQPTAPYAIDAGDYILDAACVRCLGALINDARGRRGKTANATFEESRGHILIKATKPIYHNDEILASYGKAYWDAFYSCGRSRKSKCLSVHTRRRTPRRPVPYPRRILEGR